MEKNNQSTKLGNSSSATDNDSKKVMIKSTTGGSCHDRERPPLSQPEAGFGIPYESKDNYVYD